MRLARVLALVLLSLPPTLWSQDHASQFKDVISWGPNKETLKVTLTIRRAEGLFMVSEQGFRWMMIGAADTGTGPIPWEEVSGWSCQPTELIISVTTHPPAEIGLKHEDLLKVVNQYLRKYAAAALDADRGCSPE